MSTLRLLVVLLLATLTACAPTHPLPASTPTALEGPVAAPDDTSWTGDTWAYETLGDLCDTVGHRLAGSDGMRRAVAWAVRTLETAGLDSVWIEPVQVPHWTRGREWASCTAPVHFDLTITGLGLSDGTGPDGIEAEVLVVRDFDELDARADEAAGRIVVYAPQWENYGVNVQYRVHGASRAARHGAVAALVRSAAPDGLSTPHTGVMRYADDAPRIPVAAITSEDAGRLARLADRGETLRIHLYMAAENHGETLSHNVVGEVRGGRWPEQIVLVAGHLDSWDVGTGAHDDGAGSVAAMTAARAALVDGRPARTVRVVLYTSEEYGGQGGDAYRDAHLHELDRYEAAFESDSGGYAPAGFTVQADSLVVARLASLAAPLAPLGAADVKPGWSGVDIRPLCDLGVPGVGHRTRSAPYFSVHHSPADTFDKIDRDDYTRSVAALVALVRAVADNPGSLRDADRSREKRP